MAARANSPITVALVDDYDVVLMGVANMFDQYRDRVVVAELDSNTAVDDAVDIVLYDSFAQAESDHEEIAVLVANPRARRVVVYTWTFHPDLIRSAQRQGAHGYISKTLPARDLVAALEAVHAGETVISDSPPRARSAVGLDWPGRGEGLSDRESEILALITRYPSPAVTSRSAARSPVAAASTVLDRPPKPPWSPLNRPSSAPACTPKPPRPHRNRPRAHSGGEPVGESSPPYARCATAPGNPTGPFPWGCTRGQRAASKCRFRPALLASDGAMVLGVGRAAPRSVHGYVRCRLRIVAIGGSATSQRPFC